MLVADIMTKQVRTVTPEDELSTISEIFDTVSFHHLLVEDEGKLVGVISDRDVLKNTSPFLGKNNERDQDRDKLRMPVRDFMSKSIITVDAGTMIDCASILLLENNISCLPVVNEDMKIDGIVSWKDILEFQVYGVDKNISDLGRIQQADF